VTTGDANQRRDGFGTGGDDARGETQGGGYRPRVTCESDPWMRCLVSPGSTPDIIRCAGKDFPGQVGIRNEGAGLYRATI